MEQFLDEWFIAHTPTETTYKFKIGDAVDRTNGYEWTSVVVANFTTLTGKKRVVCECTAVGAKGALHIFNEEQLELKKE